MPPLSRNKTKRPRPFGQEDATQSVDNESVLSTQQTQPMHSTLRESIENEIPNSARNHGMPTQPLTTSNSINISHNTGDSDDEEYSKPPSRKRRKRGRIIEESDDEEVSQVPDPSQSSDNRTIANLSDDESEQDPTEEMSQTIEPSTPSNPRITTSIDRVESQATSDLIQSQEIHSNSPDRNPNEEENEFEYASSQNVPSQLFESDTQMNNLFRNNAQEEAERAYLLRGEVGHIKEILLEHFMCHTKFEIKFGPRINLIYGPNGSGKSAISNALQIGFGGRATATNRAKGLADFIQTGQTRAKITIKISNESDVKELRYRHDKYGNVIVVERVILSSGGGSYKIRNGKTNEVISDKKEELENIKKHFSILIDNPICILTQETSKQFLNSKKPQEKFELFNKATQLEDLYNDYKNAKENRNKAEAMVAEKQDTLEMVRKNLEEHSRLVKIIEILKNSVAKIEELNNEAIWASLNEKQADLNKLSEQLNEHVQKCGKAQKSVDELEESIKEYEQKKVELASQLENIAERARIAGEEHETLRKECQEQRNLLANKTSDLNTNKREIRHLSYQINDIMKRIGTHEEDENNFSNLEKQCEELSRAIEEKKLEESQYRKESEQKSSGGDEFRESIDRLMDEDRMVRAKIQANNAEMERLSRGQQNRLNRYGPRYAEMLDQVKRAYERGNFREKPYGPIGEFIHLEDFSAAFAVESMLKNMIYAFVVDNAQDSKTLKQIFTRFFSGNQRQPIVIIRKYVRRHNVTHTETRHPKFKNFLELLNIKEDPVANCLIDHCRIEKLLYIPDFDESMELLSRRDTVPANCINAYTSGGDMMYPSTERTEFKIYPNKRQQIPKILVKDYKSTIDNYRKEIEKFNIRQSQIAEELKDLKRQRDEMRKEVDVCFKKANDLKLRIMSMERELRELKSKSNEKPVEIMVLREEVSKMEEEKKSLEEQGEAMATEQKTLHEKYLEMQKEVDRREKAVHDIWNSNKPLSSEEERIDEEISRFNQKMIAAKKSFEELSKVRATYTEKLKAKEDHLNAERQSAIESTGGVIETERSSKDILFEIKKIEVIISQNESMTNPNEQRKIITEYHALCKQIQKNEKDLEDLLGYFKDLTDSVTDRDYVQQKLRSYIVTMVNYYFEEVLEQKGFSGQILVNFSNTFDDGKLVSKQNTLDVVVRPRDERQFDQAEGSQTTVYSSTKSLSGGERSYSTVAFIIALWGICNSPFKILDEVDVFMDMVTRKIAIDTLIEFAKTKSCKQYIFLSPLRMQTVENDELTKILLMPEVTRPTNN